jgi:hypothetical protein
VVTDLAYLLVDCTIDLPDFLVVARIIVEHGVGFLELNKSELRFESVGEISECFSSHSGEFEIVLKPFVATAFVGLTLGIHPILSNRFPNLIEDTRWMTLWILGCKISRNDRTVDIGWWTGHGCVDNDTGEARLIGVLPERSLTDIGRIHDIPLVAIEPKKIEDTVFAGIHSGV